MVLFESIHVICQLSAKNDVFPYLYVQRFSETDEFNFKAYRWIFESYDRLRTLKKFE